MAHLPSLKINMLIYSTQGYKNFENIIKKTCIILR